MARPTKQGIDFFSLDCNFDDKTDLFLMESGPAGLGVLVTIWQLIYSNDGYFIRNDNDLPLLIKRRVSGDINDINSTINLCLSRNIFSSSLHDKYKILTSRAIQKRYFDAAKKKKIVNVEANYLLVDVSDYKNLVNSDGNLVNSSGNATKEKEKEKEKEYKTLTSEKNSDSMREGKNNSSSDESKPDKPITKAPKKPKAKKPAFEPEHYQLAVEMSNPVMQRFPTSKINLDEWARAIRLLIDTDGYTQDQIITLWRFVVADEGGGRWRGWSSNCRSPMKLRQSKDGLTYFEIIKNQMHHGGGKGRPGEDFIAMHTDTSWADDYKTLEAVS